MQQVGVGEHIVGVLAHPRALLARGVAVVRRRAQPRQAQPFKCAQLVGTARTAPVLADRMPPEITYGTGQLGVIATVAAYRDGGPWLADVLDILDANRTLLGELLLELLPRARYVAPQASYLGWIDFREYDLGDDPAVAFLERGRVALSSGPSYGTGGEGFARLNLATSPRILAEIVRRMSTVVQ